jgi:hypothetical protein
MLIGGYMNLSIPVLVVKPTFVRLPERLGAGRRNVQQDVTYARFA